MRPELLGPPEIFYDETEARKYTSSSRIVNIQEKLSERALELLSLPDDGVPRFLLDMGCGSGRSGETISENGHHWIGLDISASMLNVAVEREVEGDLLLGDMGQGLGLRSGVIDGAISISAVQWLCNADKSSHEPRLRLNSKKRKAFLVLTCGPPVQTGKNEYDESCSEDDEENGMVFVSDRNRPKKKQRTNKKCKGKEWVLKKKEQSRRKGNDVPADSKYTGRKRKSRF